ncbi:MAG: hypothetical protein IJ009_04735 [Clostridia bacterium]|nr:hypothetical protein [Clostridia bacterium]
MTWLKNNSYAITRLVLYQFGIAVLGIILITATSSRGKLACMVSAYAVIFYLILLYMVTWEDGAKDRIRADSHGARVDNLMGLKLSLCANVPNFLLVLLMLVGYLFGSVFCEAAWAQTLFVIAHTIGVLWEAMYTGIVNTLIDPAVSSQSPLYLIAYAVLPVFSLGACTLGYFLGAHDKRIFFFIKGKKKS